jgi:hypothetical protein
MSSTRTKKTEKSIKTKPTVRRGKDALLDRYGYYSPTEQDKKRRDQIDWLAANLVNAMIVFGSETVQRKLCELKGEHFDDYDDPND